MPNLPKPDPPLSYPLHPMKPLLTLLVSCVLAAPPVWAQHTQHPPSNDPDQQVADGGIQVAGWAARLDRADAKLADVRFRAEGEGFHVTSGPAAIFYHEAHRATGAYTVQGTFTQTKAPAHPEAYGLFFGGQQLQAENQAYVYFLVRGDGKFLVKYRTGGQTQTLVNWTEHAAVQKPDANGKATNTLAAEVLPEALRLLVNGTEVARVPKTVGTDGHYGLRINHNLDVVVSAFGQHP